MKHLDIIKEEHTGRPYTAESRTTVDTESSKPPKANTLSLNQLLHRWGYKEAKYPIEESKFEEEREEELTDEITPYRRPSTRKPIGITTLVNQIEKAKKSNPGEERKKLMEQRKLKVREWRVDFIRDTDRDTMENLTH